VATCEWSLGRADDARERFRLASDLDRLPQGAPTSPNDIVREVAREDDAILVDHRPRVHAGERSAAGRRRPVRRRRAPEDTRTSADREGGGRRHPGIRLAGTHIRWNLDAYTDPDPETLLDGHPEMRAREKIARQLSCSAAGRPDCVR
jgi:hypothetical protein